MTDKMAPVELLVCIKCKRGDDAPEDGERPGSVLFERLAAGTMPDGVTLSPVECLQNCDAGCSVAMRGGDHRWTYVYGNFHEASDTDLIVERGTVS